MKKLLVLLALIGSLLATNADACQKYFANVQDSLGNTLGGVTITVTIFDTTTLATIYSDSGCASTLGNPLVSNTDGTYSFYANDGHYSLSFFKADYTIAPVYDVLIFEPLGSNIKSVAEFPSSDNICAANTGAIEATASTVRTIYVNSAVACTSSLTAPSTISWVFLGKGSVTVANGVTLVINGPVINLTDHAVWLGTGTTSFGAGAGPDPYGKPGAGTNPIYSSSMSIDVSTGKYFTITPSNGSAFALASITRPAYMTIGVNIVNTTGGALGAGTFTCCKASAWTQPATGFNRWIFFKYNGTVWQEVGKSAADVPN